ncbi:glycosyltransferase [Falsihalocynthiibacter sp. BN13B15]|uniref:glycosyltransferase n=1 Tax=Falsihalocynthiibacter sp. BN13B15 TaxID=3240871 RepID=UPI00350E9481
MLFEDRTGTRVVLWRGVVASLLIGLPLWAGDYLYRIYNLPTLPHVVASSTEQLDPDLSGLGQEAWFESRLKPEVTENCQRSANGARKVFGYLPANDPRALSGFWQHCSDLDAVIAESFVFDAHSQGLTSVGQDYFTSKRDVQLPEVLLSIKPQSSELEQGFERFLMDQKKRATLVEKLALETAGRTFAGLCLDLTGYPALASDGLVALLDEVASMREGSDTKTCLIAGADAALWQRKDLIDAVDFGVVQGFQTNRAAFTPIAPADWFAPAMAEVSTHLPVEKRVIALGAFGEQWQTGRATSQTVSYSEALWMTNRFKGNVGENLQLGNTYLQFVDTDRQRNRIWLSDAVSLYNQMRALENDQTVAVWPLGYEDPAIWPVLSAPVESDAARNSLSRRISLEDSLIHIGRGVAVMEVVNATVGRRKVTFDGSGRAITQTYETLPTPAILRHDVHPNDTQALVTFNGFGGESDLNTLLGVLHDNNISATFFLRDRGLLDIGAKLPHVEALGHTLGTIVRSLATAGPFEADLEQLANNKAQHVLAHLTGHRTTLIRNAGQPFDMPSTRKELAITRAWVAQDFIPISNGAVFQNPETDRAGFVAQLREASLTGHPAVMSFDLTTKYAAELIATLPDLFADLRRDGFTFAPLAEVANLGAAEIAPLDPISKRARDTVTYRLLNFWYFGLTTTFLVLLVFAIVRSLIYLVLAFFRKPSPQRDPEYLPGITVVVPAYNEANVIVRSVWSILGSNYPNFEIIVVDDGSSDGTYDTVNAEFHNHPRVRIIRQENGGKWQAENHALQYIKTPFFVGVDADTILDPDALGWLVQHFKDERVGAVAGFVEVGNRKGYLTSCQALEYLVSQAVTRRSFETINGIFVVPGAIGAWRVAAVEAANRYSGDTITEDADLTVAVHRAGYTVRFQEQARAYTEAPEQTKAFLKQRRRWTLGMLQTSWKHWRSIPERRAIGLVSIMDAIWFSLLTSMVSPFVDLLLLSILVKTVIEYSLHGALNVTGFPTVVLISYIVLVAIDMAYTLTAFWFERKFDLKLLLLTIILRFGYRQLIYFSSFQAIRDALTGRLPGWQKLERTASRLSANLNLVSPVLVSIKQTDSGRKMRT